MSFNGVEGLFSGLSDMQAATQGEIACNADPWGHMLHTTTIRDKNNMKMKLQNILHIDV